MKRAKKPKLMERTRNKMREKKWNRIRGEKVLIPLVLERISSMRIYEDFIILKEDNDLATLFAAYIRKYGVSSQIYSAIDNRLCEIGRSCFGELVHKYCDHVSSPDALSFALCYGTFSSDQVKFIEQRLDHGETMQEFCNRSDILDKKVIAQLTKIIKKVKPKQSHSSRHEQDVCADGGPCLTCC